MARTHVELHHLTSQLGRALDELGTRLPDRAEIDELQQVLYGLHALLRLHFEQEEENYFSLAEDATPLGIENPRARR
jgi:hypothetical protein